MTDPVLPRDFILLHSNGDAVRVRPERVVYYAPNDTNTDVKLADETLTFDEPASAVDTALNEYDRKHREFAVFLRMQPALNRLAEARRALDAAQPIGLPVKEGVAAMELEAAQDEILRLALAMTRQPD